MAKPRLRKIRVFDGTLVDPYDLKPSDMKPIVFMHSISCLARYTGHAAYPYSVGQHSRNLCWVVPPWLKRAAIVHDFSEAFFNDLASPVKHEHQDYRAAEHACSDKIAAAFDVSKEELDALDPYDKSIYINERDALFAGKLKERGRGDGNLGLDMSAFPDAFREELWRDVRGDLFSLWMDHFPDFDIETGERR